MVFLNGFAILALPALAVPIIVHLRRQRRAKSVDWAAMQFLTQSVVNRQRWLALEHLLLLLCRCLLILLFVLAMARPQLTSASEMGWIPALTLGFVGLFVLTCGVVIKTNIWNRMGAAAVGLLLIASVAVFITLNGRILADWDQPRDIAIVIDASSSMQVEIDGISNFRRACEEASLLVGNLPSGSTVTVFVGGPVITTPLVTQTNLNRVSDILAELEATGGGTDLRQALEHSRLALEKSPNSRKQIVVFSDDQLRPWQTVAAQAFEESNSEAGENPFRPDALADGKGSEADSLKEGRELFCRVLPLPTNLSDVSVTDLQLEPGLVSIHRHGLVAEIFNGGTKDVTHIEVELLINEKRILTKPVRQLEKQSRAIVRFEHSFPSPGRHIVSARVKRADILPENNIAHRVIHVKEDLPVLIVNGNSSHPLFQRPATFIQLALDPGSLNEPSDASGKRSQLVKVDTVDAAEINESTTFADYKVILLCDVPRLPADTANRLSNFIKRGGGLWVLPGERCEPNFYNNWTINSTKTNVLPTVLKKRSFIDPESEKPLELDFDSVAHVILDPLIETGQHDLTEFQVSVHWELGEVHVNHPAQIAARLSNGAPLLVEHSVGRGRVLLSAISMDSLESNLISRAAFPVLAHVSVEHLANGNKVDLNRQPQREMLIQLDRAEFPEEQSLTLEGPDGRKRRVAAFASNDDYQTSVAVGLAATPGVYQLIAETENASTVVPFTVLSARDECDLTVASQEKLVELGQDLEIQWIANIEQIHKLARGSIETLDLWKYFAAASMLMLAFEVLVMHWVTSRRNAASSTVMSYQNHVDLSARSLPPSSESGAVARSSEFLGSGGASPPPMEAVR